MPDVWFTADTHFGHGSIIDYCDRPFADADDMRERLIENWNNHVRPDDDVWHLGDFSLGLPDSAIRNVLKALNGHKHLVLGNHDERTMARDSSAFMGEPGLWEDILPGYVERTFHGQAVVMCHYAMETWKHERNGTWMLHGHSHGRLRTAYRGKWGTFQLMRLDVGVDPVAHDLARAHHPVEPTVWWPADYRPISMDEVGEKMRNLRSDQPEEVKATCAANSGPFVNVADPRDVVTYTCDLPDGHDGNHHCPINDKNWLR